MSIVIVKYPSGIKKKYDQDCLEIIGTDGLDHTFNGWGNFKNTGGQTSPTHEEYYDYEVNDESNIITNLEDCEKK